MHGLGFWVTALDVQKSGPRSGSHDMVGGFWSGEPLRGVCSVEHKFLFGKGDVSEKLAARMREAVDAHSPSVV